MPKNSRPKLPYINEDTLAPSASTILYVQDDTAYGLGSPADSGYLVNDGPGALTVTSSDNGKRKAVPMTVNVGETAVWEHYDDEQVHTLFITADALGAAYRCKFTRACPTFIEQEVEEVE